MTRSADTVYGNGPSGTPSPLPPLVGRDHPSTHPGGDGPGHVSTAQPPPAGPAAQHGGGALPLTGYDLGWLIVAVVVAVAFALLLAIGAKSNRPGDR